MKQKKIEILAPAGSFDSLKAAIAAGADAVYMGGSRYGARAYAKNADRDEMIEAISYAHLHGRRLYMTVNTLMKEEELEELYEYMLPFYEAGLDGVIVQDLGGLAKMREWFPGLELHASTQMTVTSSYGAAMLKELGCCRVVPARELSLSEIRRIYDETGMEIETFVHGALCYCYSGQCLMSSLIGGRSGNRGRCAQPCRLPYEVLGREETEQGRKKVLNPGNQKHVLSMKDLCALDLLPELVEAGVYSMKIEGRMKSPRYTAGVVRIYRKYADLLLKQGPEQYRVDPKDKRELAELFDRGGFTPGYYEQHNGSDMLALKEKPEFREGNQKLFDFLDQTYVESEKKEAVEGCVLLREGEPSVLTLSWDGITVSVFGPAPQPAKNQPATEETVRKQLNKTGGSGYTWEKLEIILGDGLFLPVQMLNELRRNGFEQLKEAVLSRDRRTAPERTDDAPRWAEERRAGRTEKGTGAVSLCVSLEEEAQLPAALECGSVACIYVDADGFSPESWGQTVETCHSRGKECFLMLPHIFRSHSLRFFEKQKETLIRAGFDGYLVRALDEVRWLKQEQIPGPWAFDASVYGWNREAVGLLAGLNPRFLTMPWELNSRELEPVLWKCKEKELESELIVYGHAPMMVSAQCIAKTVGGCRKKRETLLLKDRTGALLPVKNHCSFCYNTILNPLPLSLLGYEEQIRSMGVDRVRLAFTRESRSETEAVLAAFETAFVSGQEAEQPCREFTRGHFRRGVE